MHELLLLGSVPAPAHSLTLKILAGLAAAQPQPYTAHHLVFKPTRSPASVAPPLPNKQERQTKPGAAAALTTQTSTDLFYLQLVGRLSEGAAGSGERGLEGTEAMEGVELPGGGSQTQAQTTTTTASAAANLGPTGNGSATASEAQNHAASASTSAPASAVDLARCPWTLEFRDLPDVARNRPVTSRLMASIPITDGQPVEFVQAMGYEHTASYLLQGHRLIHKDIQILLTQTLIPSQSQPSPAELPLDPSGSWLLQASVRVADGSVVETMAQGMAELKSLRDALRGVVELEVCERGALDTRVR